MFVLNSDAYFLSISPDAVLMAFTAGCSAPNAVGGLAVELDAVVKPFVLANGLGF